MRNIVKSIIFFCTFCLLSACGSVQAPSPKKETAKEELPTASFEEKEYATLAKPSNELGAKLLQLAEPSEEGNVFISPVSLITALSMLGNGAEDKTQTEIIEAMQANGMTIDEVNRANASLLSRFQQKDSDVALKSANSVWLNKNYTMQKVYKQVLRNYYTAKAEEIDVVDPKSVSKINEWVQQATNGKIDKVVTAPLNESLVLFLINAIYFKAPWQYPFAEGATTDKEFELENGELLEVPFMTLQQELPYFETEEFQAVSLPYGEEGRLTMDVYVPKEGLNTDDFLSLWTEEHRAEWKDSFEVSPGTVQFPKFQMEYEIMLNEVLGELGMRRAFGEKAQLGNLVNEEKERLFVSEVLQKTYVSVDEKGTEAAAVTSIGVETKAMPHGEPFVLQANRPFIIFIREPETDLLLFAGKIAHPQEKQ